MARYAVLKSFYGSEAWQRLRHVIIAERDPICVHCHKIIVDPLDCQVHHIKGLTPENVMDASISLNPDNLEISCRDCHNKEHNRFGHSTDREIYIVYGSPLSGKTTFVRNQMQHGDIVVDMDELYSSMSLLPEYDKPNELLSNVIAVRNLLIDNIKTRYGKWHNAWVIGGYPDKYQREQLAQDIGAELIFCDVSEEECISRVESSESLRYRKDEYKNYIRKWFERYT